MNDLHLLCFVHATHAHTLDNSRQSKKYIKRTKSANKKINCVSKTHMTLCKLYFVVSLSLLLYCKRFSLVDSIHNNSTKKQKK